MGNHPTKYNTLINYEYVQQNIIVNDVKIINTLSLQEQHCLIRNTLSTNQEIEYIDGCIQSGKQHLAKIILYGKNCTDKSVFVKQEQLISLGFASNNIHIYGGGLFEWLLLQDIYGNELFPTTTKELDILKFK